MKTWMIRIGIIIDLLLVLSVMALWLASPLTVTLNFSLTVFTFLLTGILIYPQRAEIKNFVKGNYFKKLTVLLINFFLVASIVGIINYLASKKGAEFDLTARKANTITPQTQKVLEMIQSPVKITLFAKREEWPQYLALLKIYQSASSKIQVDAIDMDLKPHIAREKGITESGTVEVVTDKTQMNIHLESELNLTNALIKTLREKPIKIYMTQGHNELACSTKEPEGLSLFCDSLTNINYTIEAVDLMKSSVVPEDADILAVIGPDSAFQKEEVIQIEAFLNKGGSLLLAIAPSFEFDRYENFRALLKKWGLDIRNDLVLDRISTVQGTDATVPLINNYASDHELTKDLKARSLFPMSSSISKLEAPEIHTSLLAFTSAFPASWAESDLPAVIKGKAVFDEKDLKGPIAVLAVAEKHQHQNANRDSRIVLSGSSSAFANAYLQQEGNRKLLTQSVAWLALDEGMASLNKTIETDSPVVLSGTHLNLIFVVSIVLIPVIFWALAWMMYRKRSQQ